MKRLPEHIAKATHFLYQEQTYYRVFCLICYFCSVNRSERRPAFIAAVENIYIQSPFSSPTRSVIFNAKGSDGSFTTF